MCLACLAATDGAPRLTLSARHRLRSGGRLGLAALAEREAETAPAPDHAPHHARPKQPARRPARRGPRTAR